MKMVRRSSYNVRVKLFRFCKALGFIGKKISQPCTEVRKGRTLSRTHNAQIKVWQIVVHLKVPNDIKS